MCSTPCASATPLRGRCPVADVTYADALNVTGLTESEVATLTLVAKHRTAKAVLTKGGVTTRNALIVWALRALIAVEGAEAHAWWDAIEAAKPAPKKRAKKGGAQ